MSKILVVFGTRPEAIKLCPVVLHLRRTYPDLSVKVCVTAQHRHLLDGRCGLPLHARSDADTSRRADIITGSTRMEPGIY